MVEDYKKAFNSSTNTDGVDYTKLYNEVVAATNALWSAYGKTDAAPTVSDLVRLRTEKTNKSGIRSSDVRDIEKYSDPNYFETSSNDQYKNRSDANDGKTGSEIDDLQKRLEDAISALGSKTSTQKTQINECQVARINYQAYKKNSLSGYTSAVNAI